MRAVEQSAVQEHTHGRSSAVSLPPKLQRTLIFLLGFVAGYVDACTFLALFGLFVAQVTGSFVIAGTEPVVHEAGFLLKGLAIPAFVVAAGAATILVSIARTTAQTVSSWGLGL